MRAQRARCDAVNSYKGESSRVRPLIRPDKFAFHESRVRVECIGRLCAGLGIGSRPTEREVDLADKTGEVRYSRRVTTFGMGACSVRCRYRAVDRAREVEMERTKRPGRRMDLGKGNRAGACIVVIRARGRPKPRTEDASRCTHCSVNQVSARYSSPQEIRQRSGVGHHDTSTARNYILGRNQKQAFLGALCYPCTLSLAFFWTRLWRGAPTAGLQPPP